MTKAIMSKELKQILEDKKEWRVLETAVFRLEREEFVLTEFNGKPYKVMFCKSC